MQKKSSKFEQKIYYVRGSAPLKPLVHGRLRLQAPDDYVLNPGSQLVIGYHWLEFLNQVLTQSKHTFTVGKFSCGQIFLWAFFVWAIFLR